jgi:CRP-like cAMP-binding protein
MPKPHQYFTGSMVYARGDEANKLFILQSGKISLVTLDPETREETRELVSPGEFFGVKSALGRFPREENAIAVADSTAMVFTIPEFEAFAMSNPKIIIKMLKVFSTQMRRVHQQIAKFKEKEDVKPDEGLFTIGEKYLKLKRYAHAKYIFSRYLAHYPSGPQVTLAAKNLQVAEKNIVNTTVKNQQQGVAKEYREAISLISKHEYEDAIQAFKKIISAGREREWVSKSEYSIGHCLFLLGKFNDCINHFSNMLTKNPSHPDAKEAMFYIGEASEKIGNKGQAALWYNRILLLPDLEAGGMRARVKQALKGLGA